MGQGSWRPQQTFWPLSLHEDIHDERARAKEKKKKRGDKKKGGVKHDRVKEKNSLSKLFLETSPSTSNRKLLPLQLSVGKGFAEGLTDCTGTD